MFTNGGVPSEAHREALAVARAAALEERDRPRPPRDGLHGDRPARTRRQHHARRSYAHLRARCVMLRTSSPARPASTHAADAALGGRARRRDPRRRGRRRARSSRRTSRCCERTQPRTRAVAADRFDAALREADAADARGREATTSAPLHGVPCTVKESIALDGDAERRRAWSRGATHRAEEDAPAVARLRAAGAIPLGRDQHVRDDDVDRVVQPRLRAVEQRVRRRAAPRAGRRAARARRSAAAARRSGSARTSAARSGCPRSSTASSATSRRAASIPNTGQFPVADGEAARMLTPGPIARRAEDLMPVAARARRARRRGPDRARHRARRPGGRVARRPRRGRQRDGLVLAGRRASCATRASGRPTRWRAAGARVRHEDLKGAAARARAVPRRAEGGLAGVVRRGARRGGRRERLAAARDRRRAARDRAAHGADADPARVREGQRPDPRRQVRRAQAAAKSLADEVEGVMRRRRAAAPAARDASRRSTAGRSGGRGRSRRRRRSTCSQMPVTQVPLGLDRRGLPLGVQVVAPSASATTWRSRARSSSSARWAAGCRRHDRVPPDRAPGRGPDAAARADCVPRRLRPRRARRSRGCASSVLDQSATTAGVALSEVRAEGHGSASHAARRQPPRRAREAHAPARCSTGCSSARASIDSPP